MIMFLTKEHKEFSEGHRDSLFVNLIHYFVKLCEKHLSLKFSQSIYLYTSSLNRSFSI